MKTYSLLLMLATAATFLVVGVISCSSQKAHREVYLGTAEAHSKKLGDIFEDVTYKNTTNGKRETKITRVLKLRDGADVSTLDTLFDDDKHLKEGRYRRVVEGTLRRSLHFFVRVHEQEQELVIADLLHPNPELASASRHFKAPLSTLFFPLSLLSSEPLLQLPNGPIVFFEVSTGHIFNGRLSSSPSLKKSEAPKDDDNERFAIDARGSPFARFTSTERWGPGIYYERATLLPALGSMSSTSSTLTSKASWPAERPAAALFFPGLQANDLACTLGQALKETQKGVWVRSVKDRFTTFDDNDVEKAPLRPRLSSEGQNLEPTLFLESDAAAVQNFAATSTKGEPNALQDALSLSEAIHKKLALSDDGGPPSALDTLQYWHGDCDNASALLVAALRARGHRARGVVGYRRMADFYGAHAWVEVLSDDDHWVPVDALVPGIGPFASHIPLFRGLGTSMDMGRVLFQAKAGEMSGLTTRVCKKVSPATKTPTTKTPTTKTPTTKTPRKSPGATQ